MQMCNIVDYRFQNLLFKLLHFEFYMEIFTCMQFTIFLW